MTIAQLADPPASSWRDVKHVLGSAKIWWIEVGAKRWVGRQQDPVALRHLRRPIRRRAYEVGFGRVYTNRMEKPVSMDLHE